jgi:hypothetical protein
MDAMTVLNEPLVYPCIPLFIRKGAWASIEHTTLLLKVFDSVHSISSRMAIRLGTNLCNSKCSIELLCVRNGRIQSYEVRVFCTAVLNLLPVVDTLRNSINQTATLGPFYGLIRPPFVLIRIFGL